MKWIVDESTVGITLHCRAVVVEGWVELACSVQEQEGIRKM